MTAAAPAPVLDAHHHFWHYTPDEYDWITPGSVLCRDYLPTADAAPVFADAGIDGCVAVQARETAAETDWLLSLARENPGVIRAVVGWAPLWADDRILLPLLEAWTAPAHEGRLCGVRIVAQNQPAGFLLDPAFNRGIAHLNAFGLTCDLLIAAHQIAEATVFVDRHPDQTFVLDHCAKPRIRERLREPWSAEIRELARRPHVVCKVSGLVTEADPAHWTDDDLLPFLTVVREAFGPDRLLFGSDAPVCLLTASYGRWVETVRRWAAGFSPTEQAALWGGTTVRVYGLDG